MAEEAANVLPAAQQDLPGAQGTAETAVADIPGQDKPDAGAPGGGAEKRGAGVQIPDRHLLEGGA